MLNIPFILKNVKVSIVYNIFVNNFAWYKFFSPLTIFDKKNVMANRTTLLTSKKVQQMIERMVHEIIERFYGEDELIIIGIETMGSKLAHRIHSRLSELNYFATSYYDLKIEKDKPLDHIIKMSPSKPDLTDKRVLLIDDVLNSGRTMIYASGHILNEAVRSLTTLCLVDRIHRRFPIKADIVGISLSTTLQENIVVNLHKGREAVYLE
jgi:pyrimidine operon attenuation protein/uracil phosphoribosyltransferase